MKFGKLLAALDPEDGQAAVLVRYKVLKKMLKQMKPKDRPGSIAEPTSAEPAMPGVAAFEEDPDCSISEHQFVEALNQDLRRINDYFMEHEEESVIRMRCLQDALSTARCTEDYARLQQPTADLHGDLVLFLHWSMLNYAALTKILKKHDKLTGSELKHSYLATALQQPFSSTSVLSDLVSQAEVQLTALQGKTGAVVTPSAPGGAARPEQSRSTQMTSAALNIWQQLRDNAKTPSTCHLPDFPSATVTPMRTPASSGPSTTSGECGSMHM